MISHTTVFTEVTLTSLGRLFLTAGVLELSVLDLSGGVQQNNYPKEC